MPHNGAIAVGGGCCCCFLVTLIVVLSTSLSKVDQSEWCLKYYWWSESVDEDPVVEPGVVAVGMGNYLIRFPNTNKYCYFRDFSRGLQKAAGDIYQPSIQVRTNDGLAISLELEFVYKLQQKNLYQLYMLVGDGDGDSDSDGDVISYRNVLVLTSLGVIDTWATTFSAKDFYSSRELVATTFQRELTRTLGEKLFVDVVSFQLQPAHFPDAFAKSIIETQEKKQDIQVAIQERQTKIIQKNTTLKNAKELAKKMAIGAEAEAEQVRLEAQAQNAQYLYRQQVLAQGYAKALSHFTANGLQAGGMHQFLQYLKLEAFKAHNGTQKIVRLGALTHQTN